MSNRELAEENWYAFVEKQNAYEKCLKTIKDLLPRESENLTKEELEEITGEIQYLIGGLEDAY